MSVNGPVRVGTRGSKLALRQAELMISLLRQHFPGTDVVVDVLRTEGDQIRDRPVTEIGDKGIFVRTIERALLDGRIDLAVHSLKDVPSDDETPGLELAAFSVREDPRDVVISRSGADLRGLPAGSTVGTGSLRRRVQVLALRPDLQVTGIRGNVDTRLRKLDAGEYDAILLAAAGLRRLGLAGRISHVLPVAEFVPDAGQAIIAIQARRDDPAGAMARAIDDVMSHRVALAERGVVRGLQAGCHSPVGAYAVAAGDRLRVLAMAAHESGLAVHRAEAEGPVADAALIGYQLGTRLRELVAG